MSPALPAAPNEFLRELCAEGVIERNGCPVHTFVGDAEDGNVANGGDLELFLRNESVGCPDLFEASVFFAERQYDLEGDQVELTRSRVFVAAGTYDFGEGIEGAFQIVLGRTQMLPAANAMTSLDL